MEIKYSNSNIEKYFTNFDLMQRKIGKELTRTIKRRINQLYAATNFGNYITARIGFPHRLTGSLNEYYAISVSNNFRLIVKPDSENLEFEALKRCKVVKIVGVVDYHGGKYDWKLE